MTVRITSMTDAETTSLAPPDDDAGLGALRTERGNLPLDRIGVLAAINGLTSQVELTQDFVNTFDVALEASYVFPLPDRGAVTRMRMTVGGRVGRVVEAELREREAARDDYDAAVAAGRRASIAEEERPDVFTLRVGNIAPGERVSIALTVVCPLAYEDGEATFRFPLVVAPRYIPGSALLDLPVGDGYADDTDAVPDASRITPPVLLPGFPHPVSLAVDVTIDPAGLTLSEVRSNLTTEPTVPTGGSVSGLRVLPGERADQDFVLRLRYGADELTDALVLVPDADGDEGTYQLTVLPPMSGAPPRPRDLVLLLDSSGSMNGWKMVAARRAAARIVDTLTSADRFAVLTFDDRVHRTAGLPEGLVEGSDRNRYRAVEHLACVDAEGGTDLLAPLRQALRLLRSPHDEDAGGARDAILVLVTDGQVGNEDQLLRGLSTDGVRVHAVGIDQAVNAGFLGRLARAGGGRCELVESEDRLDAAMHAIHRRIGAPLARIASLQAENGLATIKDTASPVRLPDLFPGVPLVVTGRYRGGATGSLTLRGTTADGKDWSVTATGQRREAPAVTAGWARAHLRDLEDRYACGEDVAQRIVDTSLRFGVLCRFTAYVAADGRSVAGGRPQHRVRQPVELPAGWVTDLDAPATVVGGKPRTVKLRNVIAVAVAGVLLLGSGWLFSLGGDDRVAATRDHGVLNTVAPERVPQPASGKLSDGSITYRGGFGESPAPAEAPAPPTSPATTVPRDIITTGSVQLVVEDPTGAADRLVAAAADSGGRVDSRSERSTSSAPVVDLVLRIPADKLDGVLADAKRLGTVESMTIRHSDVTSQRVDLDARIQALQTSIDRLLDLMRRANSTSDLLSAESSLTQRQAELDSIRSQRATLGDQISYATIDVHLSAKPKVQSSSGVPGALGHGWLSLVSAVEGLMLTVAFLLPWLVVLGVLAVVSYYPVRRVLARRRPAHGRAGQETADSD